MRGFRTITLVALLAVMLAACAQPMPAAENTAAPAEEAAAEPVQVSTEGLPAYTGGPAELRMGWWG
ncbi:MAG: hypothetical protein KDE47_01375, partial [Caldilineaceae bacterium]|nr:hypothetical protein [Caldilineaceae bacterium]